MVRDREAWRAAAHGVVKSQTSLHGRFQAHPRGYVVSEGKHQEPRLSSHPRQECKRLEDPGLCPSNRASIHKVLSNYVVNE